MTASKIETFKEWLKEFKENNKKRKWNHKYYWNEGKKIFIGYFLIASFVACKKDNGESLTVNEQHAHTCTIQRTWIGSGTVNTITEYKYLRESDMLSYETANTHSDNDLIQTCDCIDQ